MDKDRQTTAVPHDVKKQKEDAHKLVDDYEKGLAEQNKGTPAAELAPPAPASATAPPAGAEPPKPGDGTPVPAATPAPAPQPTEDVQTLIKQRDQLLATIDDLKKFIADENRDTWKQKFMVVDGKFKAETAPALKKVNELEGEVKRLTDELETARKARPAEPETLEITEFEKKTAEAWGVEPEQVAAYTKGVVDRAVAAFAKQKPAEPKTTAAEPAPAKPAEPATAAEPTAEPAAQPKVDPVRSAYFTELGVKVPNWREVQKNPEFENFVRETRVSVGGVAGQTLMEALIEADAKNDALTVSRIYSAFNQLVAKPAASAPETPERPNREAAPASSKGGSGAPVETDTWPLERVAQFENDVATGKIKMGSEEYNKLKASRDAYLAKATFGGN